MIWRSAIVAGYVALAIAIGIAYGGGGLAVLVFYYAWAGAWVVFLLAWGWAARAAGGWSFRRRDTSPAGRDVDSPPGDGLAEAAASGGVGVERESLPARDAKRPRPVPVL